MQFALVAHAYNVVTGLTQDGARVAAAVDRTLADGEAHARPCCAPGWVQRHRVRVGALAPAGPEVNEIAVQAGLQPIVPWLGEATIPLRSRAVAEMRALPYRLVRRRTGQQRARRPWHRSSRHKRPASWAPPRPAPAGSAPAGAPRSRLTPRAAGASGTAGTSGWNHAPGPACGAGPRAPRPCAAPPATSSVHGAHRAYGAQGVRFPQATPADLDRASRQRARARREPAPRARPARTAAELWVNTRQGRLTLFCAGIVLLLLPDPDLRVLGGLLLVWVVGAFLFQRPAGALLGRQRLRERRRPGEAFVAESTAKRSCCRRWPGAPQEGRGATSSYRT